MNKNMLRFAIPFHIANYERLHKQKFKCLEEYGWKRAHIIRGENNLKQKITRKL